MVLEIMRAFLQKTPGETKQFALAVRRAPNTLTAMCNKLAGLVIAGLLIAARVPADEIEALLQNEMSAHHVAGMTCLVIKDGKPLTHFCAGSANLEWPAPVDEQTVFEIGSVSKQFAAASILLLAEDGKLSVDDRISKFFTNTPAAWTNITVRHLLSHTSGLKNYDGLDGFEMRQHLTQAQFIERLAAQPVNFALGEKWAYCNSGFNLLGYIVENVSGKKYWDFLQERIFTPLQMTNTTRRDPWLIIPHRAAGYEFKNGKYRARDYDLTELFAAGAIVSTAADLAKWDAALLGKTFLKESSRHLWWTAAMLNNGKNVDNKRYGEPGSYGFGWFISTVNGHRNIGHSGITSGFSAANELFPDDHLTIIILSNTDEGVFAGNLANKVARTLLTPVKK
jgi:CubicO group peptidase (beta-lactamase class C family)